MSQPGFDRWSIRFKPLSDRKNKVLIPRDLVSPDAAPREMSAEAGAMLAETAERIRAARAGGGR